MTRAVDLFAGWGGFTEGAERVPGVDVLWAANHWPLAVEAHALNHPGTAHSCQPGFVPDTVDCQVMGCVGSMYRGTVSLPDPEYATSLIVRTSLPSVSKEVALTQVPGSTVIVHISLLP